MNKLKKIYSSASYNFPYLIKIIEHLFYCFNNMKANKKEYIKNINEGKLIFDNIIKDDKYYYIYIDKGIGDLLAVASYAYCLKEKYKKPIAFVVNKNFIGILKYFDYISKVIGCTKNECQKIELYLASNDLYETNKFKYCYFKMKVARNGRRNWSSANWNKKLLLTDRYKKNVFNLSDDYKMYRPKLKFNKQLYNSIIKKYHIETNSILLIPYANTVSNFKISFWIDIVIRLKEKGYIVYTNIGNPKKEVEIQETKGLNMTLDELFIVAPFFAKIISMRCGLAEYLALSNSKIIVLNDSIKNYDRWDDINVYSTQKCAKNIYLDKKKNNEIIEEIIKEV